MINQKLIFVSISVIALLVGGFFWIESKKTTPASVDSSQKQAVVESEVADNAQTIDEKVWYAIPELGIKMRLEKSFADELEYKESIQSKGWYVILSSKSVRKIDPENCSSENEGAFGSIIRVDGSVEEFAKENNWRPLDYYVSLEKSGLLKRLDDFFIYYEGTQSPCDGGLNASIKDISSIQLPIIHAAIKTIEKIK